MSQKTASIHTMESGNNNKKSSPPELPADAVRREEMDLIFQQCRADDWAIVLRTVTANPLVGLGQMVMDNHISTTIIHQAITSKGDTDLRAQVVLKILEVTPAAAAIRNGYGSLPLHVIAQRNTKMKAETKEKLIIALVHANVEALAAEGGTGKRTPLHIIFTDYISPGLTKMMINHGARACFMRDKKGWLPAHVACSRHCSPEKLRMLLAVNPAALYELTQDDQSLLDLAKSTATKCHPNFALIDELKQQLIRRQQAGSSRPFMPHTPVSSEDSGSATRNRVGSSDSNNSSHPSVAEVAENMGNVAVSLPEQNHNHDHHMESWEQQPPPRPFHRHELDPQHRPMPPLELPQLLQHQYPQYHHMMQPPPPPQPQPQQHPQQPQKQPQQQQQQSRYETQGQHSRKRKVTDANAASEALLLLSRDSRDPPAAEGSLGSPSHDMDDDSDDDDHPTQIAKV